MVVSPSEITLTVGHLVGRYRTNDLHQWKGADPPHVVLLLPQSPCQLEGFEDPAAPSVLAGVELEQWKAGDQARVD